MVLPAHAQTTTFDELRFQGAVGIGNASLLESVIGTAHAATDFTGSCIHFTIENLVGGKGYIQVEIATSGKLIGDPNGNVVDDAFFFNFNGGDWISGELIRDDSGAVIRVDGKVNDEDYSGFPAGSSGCETNALGECVKDELAERSILVTRLNTWVPWVEYEGYGCEGVPTEVTYQSGYIYVQSPAGAIVPACVPCGPDWDYALLIAPSSGRSYTRAGWAFWYYTCC